MEKVEQTSIGPKFIQEEDLQHVIPLLRDHYKIEKPTEENITPEILRHVWDKLGLHVDSDDIEGEKNELLKEILELEY